MNSHVLRFLDANRRCWVKGKGVEPLTHTFLDGSGTGKIAVPASLRDDFLNAVTDDVERGTLPSLNELRCGDFFNMYADLDIHCTSIRAPNADDVGAVAVRAAARFVPQMSRLRCVVLTTPDKSESEGRIKRGVHLHFPALRLGLTEALLMREAMIDGLTRELGDSGVDWAEDFDNKPYQHEVGGLRMVGAPKAVSCSDCRGRQRDLAMCINPLCSRGKVTFADRRYALHSVLNAAGERDEEHTRLLMANAGQLVRACSIQTPTQALVAGWSEFTGCPSFSPLVVRPNQPPAIGAKKRAFPDEKTSVKRNKWPSTPVTDPRVLAQLTDIFRERFNPAYANVNLVSVKYAVRDRRYFVQHSGEGSNWCMNKNDRHTGNRVWGMVTSSQAILRCHSDKKNTVDRTSGRPCCDFSVTRSLRPSDLAVLFGGPAPKRSTSATGASAASALTYSPDDFMEKLRVELIAARASSVNNESANNE